MIGPRSHQPELLDDPEFDPALASRSYRLMSTVNRYLGGERMVRQWIRREARRLRAAADERSPAEAGALRILDIGAGGCDIAIAAGRRLERAGIQTHWTCLDPSDHARRIAAANIACSGRGDRIELSADDIRDHRPGQPYDLAVGSMFFHHLDDGAIVELVSRLRGFVRHSLLVNDLRRSGLHYFGARLLTLPLPAEVRHDALVSIRKGFRLGELRRLLAPLGLPVEERYGWLLRIGAVIRFDTKGTSCP